MEGGTCPFANSGPPALDRGRTDTRKQDNVAHPHELQIGEEPVQAYSTVLNPSFQSAPTQGIDGGWTEPFESLFLPSTFLGHEGVPPASIDYPVYTKPADAETAYNLRKDDTTPNFTASSPLTEISKKKRATVSSLQLARRPTGMREAPKRSYSCDVCGKQYSQPQGVSRHHQAVHQSPHSCLYCAFKWSRPYQYRAHLEKWHLDVNSDNVLGKPAGSRRKSTIIGRNLPQHASPPPIERQGQTESPPAVADVTHTSLPVILSAAYYDPGLERAGPAVTTHKREGAILELPDPSDAPSAFSFTEVRAQSVTDVGISSQRGQLWLPPARPGGSIAAERPSGV